MLRARRQETPVGWQAALVRERVLLSRGKVKSQNEPDYETLQNTQNSA